MKTLIHYSIRPVIQGLQGKIARAKENDKADEPAKKALIILSQIKGEVACGKEEVEAVTDPQKVTCTKCQVVIDELANIKGDPIVRARINNNDLKDGQDFNFSLEGVKYHGVSGAVHRVPKSVVDHLNSLAVPQKKFRENQEESKSMVDAGVRHRYTAIVLEGEAGATQPATKPADKPAAKFKDGDKVKAEFEGGDTYDGEIVKVYKNGKFDVHFPEDDTTETFVESELALIPA